MARGQPLYTLEEQYTKLDTDLPYNFRTINLIKFRLLVYCSANGSLESAKSRFLSLIQDTEINTLFASILEVPEEKVYEGVNSIQVIHNKMKSEYGLFTAASKELILVGIPEYTIDLFDRYFYGNEDPIFKLSILAAMVMMAYIKDDEINNRKE